MQTREDLVVQLAHLLDREAPRDLRSPTNESRARADEILTRVELFLGTDIEDAKEILTRVFEDVT
jgi:hypothetical protein